MAGGVNPYANKLLVSRGLRRSPGSPRRKWIETSSEPVGPSGRRASPAWSVALLGLCYAGYIKGAPFFAGFQVDLTGLFIGICLLGVVINVVNRSGMHSRTTYTVLVLWSFFLIGMVNGLWADGGDKALVLATVTLLCAASPAIFFESDRSRRWLVWAVMIAGAGMALAVVLWPDDAARETFGRLTLEGSSPIGNARVIGAGLVAAFVLGMAQKRGRWWRLALAVVLGGAIIAVGSRGPFVGIVLAVTVALLMSRVFRGFRRVPVIAFGAASLCGLMLYVLQSTNRSALRIGEFVSGTSSDEVRLSLIDSSVRQIVTTPLGIGWGGFSSMRSISTVYGDLYNYPHNIFIEIALEGGWLAVVAFFIFVTASMVGYARSSTTPIGAALFGLGVYWLIVAQTSSNVNGNRTTWAFLTLGIMLGAQQVARITAVERARGSNNAV